MPSGGDRVGTPGRAYGNRTDLAGNYGDKAALARQTAAAPMPTAQPPATPASVQRPVPPRSLLRPTERPDEPVTHGLPSGPGAGPEVLGLENAKADDLRAIFMADPMDEDLRELVEALDDGL